MWTLRNHQFDGIRNRTLVSMQDERDGPLIQITIPGKTMTPVADIKAMLARAAEQVERKD